MPEFGLCYKTTKACTVQYLLSNETQLKISRPYLLTTILALEFARVQCSYQVVILVDFRLPGIFKLSLVLQCGVCDWGPCSSSNGYYMNEFDQSKRGLFSIYTFIISFPFDVFFRYLCQDKALSGLRKGTCQEELEVREHFQRATNKFSNSNKTYSLKL